MSLIKKYQTGDKLTSLDKLKAWEPKKTSQGKAFFSYDSDIGKMVKSNRSNLKQYRKDIADRIGVDIDNLEEGFSFDPKSMYPEGHEQAGQRVIPEDLYNKYLGELKFNQEFRTKVGLNPVNYAGTKEGLDIPLEQQLIGPKHLGAKIMKPQRKDMTAKELDALTGKKRQGYPAASSSTQKTPTLTYKSGGRLGGGLLLKK